ncbi:MAG: 5-(carboxyamino)imidazole ribonucleotide mutase, partial [Flavobacteriales bacterium]|nr:5-(carboxyamino)imidazole ribonucleotide mutase [Flavobacteriales bacterium]
LDAARNAGILAVQMLAIGDEELHERVIVFKENLKEKIVKANEDLKEYKFESRV